MNKNNLTTIILLSHSKSLAIEAKKFFQEMIKYNKNNVDVVALGGDPWGGLGNNPQELRKYLKNAQSNNILIIVDIGSSLLVAQTIKEEFKNKNIHISKGSFIEGGFAAITLANSKVKFEDVIKIAQELIEKY